jgi:hypothetical protein
MKLFDIVDLCDKFRNGRITHDHWRVYAALGIVEMEESQAKILAAQIAKFKEEDGSNV